MAGTNAEKWRAKVSRPGLLDRMSRTRSRVRWFVGRARRVSDFRFVLKTGEDHLNGEYCKVNDLSLGNITGAFALALGNHGHSVL